MTSTKHMTASKGVVIAAALVLLQSALYGFGNPISKVAYETLPVFSLLTARYGIAVLTLLLLFGRRVVKTVRACKVSTWLIPSILIAASYLFNNIALTLTSATTATFLSSLSVIMAPFIALILHRTRYPLRNIPILALLVVGLYLMCKLGGVATFGWGEVISLLASLCLAGALVLGGKAMESIDAITLSTMQLIVSLLMAFVCALLLEGGVRLEAATPTTWGIIVYLAIPCSVIGFILQNTALRFAPAALVAVVQTLSPAITAGFSFIILGEVLSFEGLVGATLIIACVLATVLLDSRAARKAS